MESTAATLNGGDPALRRSYSLPARENSNTADHEESAAASSSTAGAVLRHSKSEDIQSQHKLDRYGFILNMDSHGNLQRGTEENGLNGSNERGGPQHQSNVAGDLKYQPGVPTVAQAATIQRRIKKWNLMLSKWSVFSTRKEKLVKKRLRKGIPDDQRGIVWPVLCNIDEKIEQNQGLYKQLVEQSVGNHSSTKNNENTDKKAASPTSNIEAQIAKPKEASPATAKRANGEPIKFEYSKSFKVIQDTIERDIHRTFPRHSMFYKSDDDHDDDDEDLSINQHHLYSSNYNNNNGSDNGDENSTAYYQAGASNLCGTAEFRNMMLPSAVSATTAQLDHLLVTKQPSVVSQQRSLIHTGNANGDTFDPAHIFDGAGGQARLRRVLKAYSTYDREIGYCQGMNFIAAMFLTLMSEEQAFWMLVCKYYL